MNHSKHNPEFSDSSQPATGKSVQTVREPGALAVALSDLPAAKTNRETGEKMHMNYFPGHREWWYLPAISAVSVIFIALGAYLISISQFGANMEFMFRNLI